MTEFPDSVTAPTSDSPSGMWLVQADGGSSLWLEEAGISLAGCAPDAGSVLAVSGEEAVELVLVAINGGDLPDLSALRAGAVPVPFVVLDAEEHEGVAREARRLGAEDYLVVSELSPRQLRRSLIGALERGARGRNLRRRIEETLSAERNMLRGVIDNLPDPIYVKDLEGRYVLDNNAHASFLGVESKRAVIGKTVFDFFEPAFAEQAHAVDMEVLRQGKPWVNHEEQTSATGQATWLVTSKVPLRNDDGVLTGLVCINRDITERKQAQDKLVAANERLEKAIGDLKRAHQELHSVQLQLIEAEKLKSIGRLAAGVAHEVKNPLAIISMGVEFLTGRHSNDETTGSVLKELKDAVARADTVIKGLLDFSAPRRLQLEESDLNAVIHAAVNLVRGEIRPGAHHVELELGAIPPIQIDRGKVSQVFVNLFTNSLQAMPDGGTLLVRTRVDQITGVGANVGGARSEVFHAGDRIVVVEVSDTGTGIPPESLGHIFEPFFSTKPTGSGTGLGMSVVRSIMNLQRGTIQMQNRSDGPGAIATLTFKAQES